jgi:hypothetical protein
LTQKLWRSRAQASATGLLYKKFCAASSLYKVTCRQAKHRQSYSHASRAHMSVWFSSLKNNPGQVDERMLSPDHLNSITRMEFWLLYPTYSHASRTHTCPVRYLSLKNNPGQVDEQILSPDHLNPITRMPVARVTFELSSKESWFLYPTYSDASRT